MTNHILVAGGTGSGKSSALQVLLVQDVLSGRATIVIDPKGGYKLYSACYDAAVQGEKVERFKIVHLAYPEYSAQYNAIGQYYRITEVSSRIIEGIDSEEAYKQFAWMKSNYIAVALHYLGIRATFDEINKHMTRCDELVVKYCSAYVERNGESSQLDQSLRDIKNAAKDQKRNPNEHSLEATRTGKAVTRMIKQGQIPDSNELQVILSYLNENVSHERKLVRNIEPILQKLTTGSIQQIMVPDYDNVESEKPIIEWAQILNDSEVVYIGTNALGDSTVSSTFVQVVLEDLTSHLGSVYQYGSDYGRLKKSNTPNKFLPNDVAIHIDELSAVKTTSVRNLLARAGEVGVKLRIYTQDLADIVQSMGGREEAETALGNFGAIFMFRVNNINTAEILTSRVQKVAIEREGRMYSATESPKADTAEDFASTSVQREELTEVPLVSNENLQALPTGQAFALINGTRLVKVTFPLISIDDTIIPDTIRGMVETMKKNDAMRVPSTEYQDLWFSGAYPEFSGAIGDSNIARQQGEVRNSTQIDGTGNLLTGAGSVVDTDAADVVQTMDMG